MLPAVDLFLTPHYPWHHHTQQQRAPNRGKNRFGHMRDVTKYDFLKKNPSLYSFLARLYSFPGRKKRKKGTQEKHRSRCPPFSFSPSPEGSKKMGGGGRSAFGRAGKKVLFGKRGRERRTLERGGNSNAPSPSFCFTQDDREKYSWRVGWGKPVNSRGISP